MPTQRSSDHDGSRRRFLSTAGAVASVTMLSAARSVFAHTAGPVLLPFYHTHTGERLSIDAPANGRLRVAARRRLNEFLRDFRTGEVHPIDPMLVDILRQLRLAVGNTGTYEIISAYRSPMTNAALRTNGGGVARNSLHMQGRAIDVRLRGVGTRRLRNAALALRRGGVGYYRRSDFIHLDTGRVRSW